MFPRTECHQGNGGRDGRCSCDGHTDTCENGPQIKDSKRSSFLVVTGEDRDKTWRGRTEVGKRSNKDLVSKDVKVSTGF